MQRPRVATSPAYRWGATALFVAAAVILAALGSANLLDSRIGRAMRALRGATTCDEDTKDEIAGKTQTLVKEPLAFEYVHPSQRSYK